MLSFLVPLKVVRMSRRAPIALPPTRADVAIAKTSRRMASPAFEETLQVITWLADEKVILGGTLLFWMYARWGGHRTDMKGPADHLLSCVVLAGMLPHLFKRLVARKRPDRTVVHGRRHGIPRSGNAWDSFPSGHALHLGAIASSVTSLLPKRFRPIVWPSLAVLAGSRIMLLAHYPSDVAAGLALGALIDKGVGRLFQAHVRRQE